MSGLVKAKKYDWKDSNLALFGSDTEKQVKKESAESEPAWAGAGTEVGLKIWRIEQFQVKDWEESEYGKFYNGDSYIVLNTYKEGDSDALLYDVHFWIGKNSSQDEYGTAAYKTVELDTFLDDAAVQHREVQGHESDLFKSYFPEGITTMEGGAKTGFRHVEPEEYRPRLLHFSGQKRNITIREIPLCRDLVKSSDVYILDKGLKLFQFNGADCSKDEKFKAMQYLIKLKGERGNADSETLDEAETSSSHEFFDSLTDSVPEENDSDDEDDDDDNVLYRYSSGSFDKVKEGEPVTRDDLADDDVFVFDSGKEVFVVVGKNASTEEKRNGLPYAHTYLCIHDEKRFGRPVTVVTTGQRCPALDAALAA
ncbi:gelsolin-like protein 2 isoform X2 [Patella vulgata]|uniref:gelsolin-like protein 2 isoform X2 n=1 Tax=Patella vulgata TaxID=6465 RepID=UPI00217FAA4E|nr:gelsolin-like protein 2 isoform X2 [Patella vulgata]XP_055958078.1 gelsolin-like protein 2 isoform X2 [Patella vulgata]